MPETPVLERLQVKHGRRLAIVAAPAKLPAGLAAHAAPDEAEVVLLFAADRVAFEAVLPRLRTEVKPGAILWLAYPKLTSPLARDLSREVVREAALVLGLDAVSQIAIDADWSAMRVKPLP